MGNTNYSSGSDNYTSGSVTPRRTGGGWDDEVYDKGRGKSKAEPGRGSPRASPRPRSRGKGFPQQTLDRLADTNPVLAAKIRANSRVREHRGLPPLVPSEADPPRAAPNTERSHREPPRLSR